MTPTHGAMQPEGLPAPAPARAAWRGLPHHRPHFPGLTMVGERRQKKKTTGRCNPVREEVEMGLWRKICAGFKLGRRSPAGALPCGVGAERGLF